MSYPFDPMRPIINLSDTRLQKIFVKENHKFATLFEYSRATGISSEALFAILQPYIENSAIIIEPVGGELFLKTSPEKASTDVQIPPTLWDILRNKVNTEEAFNLWRLMREMESGGWVVEADPIKMPANSDGYRSLIAIKIKTTFFPVLVLPKSEDLGNPAGPLSRFLVTGNRLIAIICKSTEIEATSTNIRKWLLSRPHRSDVTLLILPEPRYQPILLSSKDQSLTPITVTKENLENL